METKIEAEAMDKIAMLVEAYQKHDQEFDQLLLDDLRSDLGSSYDVLHLLAVAEPTSMDRCADLVMRCISGSNPDSKDLETLFDLLLSNYMELYLILKSFLLNLNQFLYVQ